MSDLSIVTGTLNRLVHLQRMVGTIRYFVGLNCEIVIVDGGSTDGTEEWCLQQEDLTFIQQSVPLGAVKAFNAGFREAMGTYVANLNDDAYLESDCYSPAIELLEKRPYVGQVAIPYSTPGRYMGKVDFVPLLGRKWVYANFGLIKNYLGTQIGWWGEDYEHYAGDAELSMKLWNLGYSVQALDDHHITHLELDDATRRPNTDSPKFYRKWREWSGPGDIDRRFLY